MNNQLTASIEFYFKGEKYSASIEMNLDMYMENSAGLPDIYSLLAQSMNIGVYSYEYEMLLAESILFTNAKGLAAEHVVDGVFNLESFESAWAEMRIHIELQAIAEEYLSIDDLEQHSELKAALMAAASLGSKPEKPL